MNKTHSLIVGYLAWFFGCFGAHRFYYGKPVSGVIWLFTFGLLGIGWVLDLFLMPSLDDEANARFVPGDVDYSASWLLLFFGGLFGLHRFYMGDILWGIIYLLTGGLFLLGVLYDILTLNDQISRVNFAAVDRRYHARHVY